MCQFLWQNYKHTFARNQLVHCLTNHFSMPRCLIELLQLHCTGLAFVYFLQAPQRGFPAPTRQAARLNARSKTTVDPVDKQRASMGGGRITCHLQWIWPLLKLVYDRSWDALDHESVSWLLPGRGFRFRASLRRSGSREPCHGQRGWWQIESIKLM